MAAYASVSLMQRRRNYMLLSRDLRRARVGAERNILPAVSVGA